MESRIKNFKRKILKLSKKQLNYQNNLAIITKTSFLNSPPNQAEHCPQCDKSDWKIGRKWYLLSDVEWCCGNDGSAASPVGGSWWGIGWSTKGGACDGSDELGMACLRADVMPRWCWICLRMAVCWAWVVRICSWFWSFKIKLVTINII